MEPLSIVHVYKDYWPVVGGIENLVRLLAEGQARRGHRVTVLVTSPGRRTTRSVEGGVSVIRAGRLATVASTPLSLALPRELARLDADVTHLHFPYPVGEVAQLLVGRSRRTVISYQSDIVRQRLLGALYRPLLGRVLDRADRLLASSPAYVASSPWLASRRDKCAVVPNGIDLARCRDADPERVAALRHEHGERIVLFVGKFRYYKGLGYLIEAMARLDATLLVAGTGPLETSLRAQAAASPAASRIRFLGEVADAELPDLLAAADLLVLPSCERSEAFGLVLVEAMAAGTPVISTELGTGTSYVNRHGETGLVVPPRDPPALAAAITELLADPARRRAMGTAAAARAEAMFSADAMVDRVLEVYAELSAAR